MKSIFLKTLSLSPFRIKPKNQRIRVADILAEEGDDDDDPVLGFGMDWRRRSDESTSLQCSSPRRIIARWLGSLRRGKERNIVVRSQKSEVGEEVCDSGRGSRLINGLDGGDSSPSPSESEGSGQCRKDASFNLGVGCSLLYLIAASKNELNKMGELQKQMETLLQNVKGELNTNDAMSKAIESDVTLAYSTTDAQEGSNSIDRFSLQSQTTSIALTDSETTIVPQQEEYVEGIDELEAEFEAELERLQIHLDGENSLKPSQQQVIRVTVEDAASNRSCSLSFREATDPQSSGTEVHCGVLPIELERRLHELLEARQQERIKELEADLECAMLKLREKEAEVSWWKDTARLLSHHVPGSSSLSSHHNPIIT